MSTNGEGKYLSRCNSTSHNLQAKVEKCRNEPVSVDYLLYGDPQCPKVTTQARLTIAAEVVVVFVIGAEFFCIHLLKGRLRNDTSLCYQAPFPASARSLQGRYPYGTQTHPLTSQKPPASASREDGQSKLR